MIHNRLSQAFREVSHEAATAVTPRCVQLVWRTVYRDLYLACPEHGYTIVNPSGEPSCHKAENEAITKSDEAADKRDGISRKIHTQEHEVGTDDRSSLDNQENGGEKDDATSNQSEHEAVDSAVQAEDRCFQLSIIRLT